MTAEVIDAAGLLQNFASSVAATTTDAPKPGKDVTSTIAAQEHEPKDGKGQMLVDKEASNEDRLSQLHRTNFELRKELGQLFRLVGEARQERNVLMDLVYEREMQLGIVELTSASSDEEEEEEDEDEEEGDEGVSPSLATTLTTVTSQSGGGKGKKKANPPPSLVFHHVVSSSGNSSRASTKRNRRSSGNQRSSGIGGEGDTEEERERMGDELELEEELDYRGYDHHKRSTRATPAKRKRVVKSAEAAAAMPRRAQPVPRDAEGQIILPLNIGMTTVHSLGCIVWDRPGFHNKRYLYPAGYHSSRPYHSATDPTTQTIYHSRILDEGGTGPVFDVVAEDAADHHYQSSSPTGAWTAIVRQINAIRGRTDYSNSASGPDFYGLSNNTISMILEELPESERCAQYQRKTYDTGSSGGGSSNESGGNNGGKSKKKKTKESNIAGPKLTISRRAIQGNNNIGDNDGAANGRDDGDAVGNDGHGKISNSVSNFNTPNGGMKITSTGGMPLSSLLSAADEGEMDLELEEDNPYDEEFEDDDGDVDEGEGEGDGGGGDSVDEDGQTPQVNFQ